MKNSVALIGFMGTGKSAVGKILAKKLNKKFVELDSLIEQRAGKPIPVIFQDDGEITFREFEIKVTKEVSRYKNQIIACGGGIVLNKINIDRLKIDSLVVYLTASPKVILKRISDDEEQRPLLKVANPAKTIKELLSYRKPFYERAADIKINNSRIGIDSVAKQIINQIKKDENTSL
jgi:shikimate kinase